MMMMGMANHQLHLAAGFLPQPLAAASQRRRLSNLSITFVFSLLFLADHLDAYFSISFLYFSITFTSPHAYFSISSSFPLFLYYFHTPIGLFLHFCSYSSISLFLLLFLHYFHIPGCLFPAPILDLYLLFLEKTRQKCHPHLAASKLLCHTKPVNRWKRLEISSNWKKQWW